MAQVQLTGISTGIDTNAIVQQLMQVESQRLAKYQAQLTNQQKVQSTLDTLNQYLTKLQTTTKALSDSSKLPAYTTTSSDTDILTLEASEKATEGAHTVVINQVATAERWVHTTGLQYTEDRVGAGNFIYSYNHQEAVITTAADTTLDELVGLINNDADNPGVTASLLYHDGAYHLVLSGDDAGTDYQIAINSSNTEVWKAASSLTVGGNNATAATLLTRLDQFSGRLAGGETITIGGIKPDGNPAAGTLTVTSDTKLSHLLGAIETAFGDAVTATLVNGQIVVTNNTSGASPMTVSLTYDGGTGPTTLALPTLTEATVGGSVTANLVGFTGGDFTKTQSAQDSQIKVDGYPPGADQWISRSSNAVDDVIQGVTLHLHDTGTVQTSLTRDVQSVQDKVSAMVAAYNTAVTFIRDNSGYDPKTKVAGVLLTDSTTRSISDSLHNALIRKSLGFLADADAFLMPGQIGLEFDQDGRLDLDATAFADAAAKNYGGLLSLIGATETGSSNSPTIAFYGASSKYTTGGTYDVQVTVAGGVITSAKIKASGESTYRDATFSGNLVSGSIAFDSKGNPLHPESGLQLSVDLAQDGTFTAIVQVKQGFAGTMQNLLDKVLKASNGWLTLDQKAGKQRMENLNDRIAAEQERLDRTETRLKTKYARLESTLTLLKAQMAALSQG